MSTYFNFCFSFSQSVCTMKSDDNFMHTISTTYVFEQSEIHVTSIIVGAFRRRRRHADSYIEKWELVWRGKSNFRASWNNLDSTNVFIQTTDIVCLIYTNSVSYKCCILFSPDCTDLQCASHSERTRRHALRSASFRPIRR